MKKKKSLLVKFFGLGLVAVLGVMTNIGSIDTGGNGSHKQLFVVAEGTEVVLMGINDNTGQLFEIDRAGIPEAGLLPEHAIFGITKHPTKNILYVTSLNNYKDNVVQWGNARIDRFSYNSGKIEYEGPAFLYTNGSGPDCADDDWGYDGQVGSCAPTTPAFSSDGLRLYVDDDSDDVVQIFQVDPDSDDLTFLWEGSDTSYNGLTVSPNDDYLYNGATVFEIDGDTVNRILNRSEGNATEIVQNEAEDNLLVTTLDNETLAIYDLTDQSDPSLIDSIEIPITDTTNQLWDDSAARYQASLDDLSMFVVVGVESVATVSFDGNEFTLLDQYADDDNLDIMNRGVAVTSDGHFALVTWFVPLDANGDWLLTGGYTVYAIADDGTLSVVSETALDVPSRVVLRL